MKRWHLFTAALATLAILAGCATLDEKQRAWIFQPGDRSWGNGKPWPGHGRRLDWVQFPGHGQPHPPAHGLFGRAAPAPGAAYNLHGRAGMSPVRHSGIRRMQELGFSVLAIDYRGFGKSSKDLPSEAMAGEDAGPPGTGWPHATP